MVAAWDSRFGAILHYPWIPPRPHCRKWIALFSGTACVFRLMFFAAQRPTTACRWVTLWQGQGASVCAQRSRLSFTAMPSKPHGARSANFALHSRAFTAPAIAHGRAGGLQTLTGAFCAFAPHPVRVSRYPEMRPAQAMTIEEHGTVPIRDAGDCSGYCSGCGFRWGCAGLDRNPLSL